MLVASFIALNGVLPVLTAYLYYFRVDPSQCIGPGEDLISWPKGLPIAGCILLPSVIAGSVHGLNTHMIANAVSASSELSLTILAEVLTSVLIYSSLLCSIPIIQGAIVRLLWIRFSG